MACSCKKPGFKYLNFCCESCASGGKCSDCGTTTGHQEATVDSSTFINIWPSLQEKQKNEPQPEQGESPRIPPNEHPETKRPTWRTSYCRRGAHPTSNIRDRCCPLNHTVKKQETWKIKSNVKKAGLSTCAKIRLDVQKWHGTCPGARRLGRGVRERTAPCIYGLKFSITYVHDPGCPKFHLATASQWRSDGHKKWKKREEKKLRTTAGKRGEDQKGGKGSSQAREDIPTGPKFLAANTSCLASICGSLPENKRFTCSTRWSAFNVSTFSLTPGTSTMIERATIRSRSQREVIGQRSQVPQRRQALSIHERDQAHRRHGHRGLQFQGESVQRRLRNTIMEIKEAIYRSHVFRDHCEGRDEDETSTSNITRCDEVDGLRMKFLQIISLTLLLSVSVAMYFLYPGYHFEFSFDSLDDMTLVSDRWVVPGSDGPLSMITGSDRGRNVIVIMRPNDQLHYFVLLSGILSTACLISMGIHQARRRR